MRIFFRNNGLSIVFFILFISSLVGQIFTGWKEHNKDRVDDGVAPIIMRAYFSSGHFGQATFEN